MLFHPANFLNVDENEDTSAEQMETDKILEEESQKSAEEVMSYHSKKLNLIKINNSLAAVLVLYLSGLNLMEGELNKRTMA